MGHVILTTPLSGWVDNPGLGVAAINLPTKFQTSISVGCDDMKTNSKYRKWGRLWKLGVTQCHSK